MPIDSRRLAARTLLKGGALQDVRSLAERHTNGFKGHNAMKLTSAQIEQFNQEGYLFFPGLFTPEETKTLTQAVPELDRKSTRLNSSHVSESRMPSSA